ncbi:MAG: hypothetical protein KIT35_03530 [Piscinibacter sp.]|uniref:hypothetical protein n=1 Tax=Piscinibacter sp. TaxID=1903157 RepID=UPI00258B5672|nr:hypothetical protein [Piscinibacter sp.]MCW5662882.1 hypothetical protein [Piscinibacter sp.]
MNASLPETNQPICRQAVPAAERVSCRASVSQQPLCAGTGTRRLVRIDRHAAGKGSGVVGLSAGKDYGFKANVALRIQVVAIAQL